MSAKTIAWHDQARRMLASGAYPSKAAIARDLGVSVDHIYEVLNVDLGQRMKRSRLDRQRKKYATDPEYRAERVKNGRRSNAQRAQSDTTRGSASYPLHVRCQPDFLSALDAWIAVQPIRLTRSEAVRRIVTDRVSPSPAQASGSRKTETDHEA